MIRLLNKNILKNSEFTSFTMFVVFYFICTLSLIAAPTCPDLSIDQKKTLLQEHLGKLRPNQDPIIVHRGYVFAYDYLHNVPKWTAWHLVQEYTDTPKRTKQWYKMGSDEILPKENQVTSSDYTGSGYHRGHIAPYFISGGDRDNDGQDAEYEDLPDFPIEDIDDACTVFEVNYMSNMTPQLPELNSQNGSWYQLETLTRNAAKGGKEFHVIAGPIFTSDAPKIICKPKNADGTCKYRAISVPDAFFKITESEEARTGYIFFQSNKISNYGCLPSKSPEECIAPISEIEKLTGLILE